MTSEAVETLLRELCVELGFCLHGEVYDALVDRPPASPEAFARLVFSGEGLDFDSDARSGLKQAVVDRVARHMDASA
ncbi:MAG: hypothetical protein Q7J26_13600 [Brevundimonas sp.]|uniref:hypothetical protein n=1 Tax=Brevundimonas sp. TaxID=1871086 RepID=UPI0027200B1B|nr:hypothetical protein [Brevundimonas sp.]MDO9609552.1 hypothetical protein [Brevundimonas sp.]